MTATFTARMPTKKKLHGKRRNYPAFTLAELIVVIVILSLLVALAQVRLVGALRRNSFSGRIQEFVSTMQMAARAAAQGDRRYEVIINLTEQKYTLREITSAELSEILDEEIIAENEFGEDCFAAYVLFDDLDETDEDHQQARFRVGHAGWAYGGKIVFLDREENPYSVLVNRMNRIVELKEGDFPILLPRRADEMVF